MFTPLAMRYVLPSRFSFEFIVGEIVVRSPYKLYGQCVSGLRVHTIGTLVCVYSRLKQIMISQRSANNKQTKRT